MKYFKIVIIFMLLLIMLGCPVLDANSSGNVHISFNVNEERSTIIPEVASAIAEYRISFSGGPESVDPVITTNGSISIDLAPGIWDILVEGLNSSGQTVASGLLEDIVVSTGSLVTEEVLLDPEMDGTGSVHITVTWPDEITVESTDITVYFNSDTAIPMSSDTITYSANSLIYNNPSVASGGSHWIKIHLVENGTTTNQDTILDSVHVYDNLESSAVYNRSSSDFIPQSSSSMILANHLVATQLDLKAIPESAIIAAKDTLHIAYGHTSHGSQITKGMESLVGFMSSQGYDSNLFAWNNGGTDGALDLHDYAMTGDLGDYPEWVDRTRYYLDISANSDVNVIIWSWCGDVSDYTEQNMIDKYLIPMTLLETEYPHVSFVYMTGHLDGTGLSGNLHLRNQQIREYCSDNNKVLYDFEDIESYDPDGSYYGDRYATDACNYDYDDNGSTSQSGDESPLPIDGDRNWAIDWQNSNDINIDWYDCVSVHSQPLNANQKAYAAWWLWARIAGWEGN